MIYLNDHRPAHVHVMGNGCSAVFNLHCPKGLPELRENYGFSKKELTRLVNALVDEQEKLCQAWRQIHGND